MKLLTATMALSALFTASTFAQDKTVLTDSDKLQIAVQDICPVSGEKLGSMGEPIKVKVGQEHAFLCCKACLSKQINPAHWQTIQTNLAKAQSICPVMDKELPASSKSIVVNGRRVFICCPGCDKKIAAQPASYIKEIDTLYAAHLSDQLQIAAQQICPVSGEELGSMGTPVKVKVGKEHAFLCCQGCVGKQLKAEHWQTVQANLAKAQATCPVMGHELPADAKSIVVNGRRIFVCCPPCLDKIKADPETYLTRLTAHYAQSTRR